MILKDHCRRLFLAFSLVCVPLLADPDDVPVEEVALIPAQDFVLPDDQLCYIFHSFLDSVDRAQVQGTCRRFKAIIDKIRRSRAEGGFDLTDTFPLIASIPLTPSAINLEQRHRYRTASFALNLVEDEEREERWLVLDVREGRQLKTTLLIDKNAFQEAMQIGHRVYEKNGRVVRFSDVKDGTVGVINFPFNRRALVEDLTQIGDKIVVSRCHHVYSIDPATSKVAVCAKPGIYKARDPAEPIGRDNTPLFFNHPPTVKLIDHDSLQVVRSIPLHLRDINTVIAAGRYAFLYQPSHKTITVMDLDTELPVAGIPFGKGTVLSMYSAPEAGPYLYVIKRHKGTSRRNRAKQITLQVFDLRGWVAP